MRDCARAGPVLRADSCLTILSGYLPTPDFHIDIIPTASFSHCHSMDRFHTGLTEQRGAYDFDSKSCRTKILSRIFWAHLTHKLPSIFLPAVVYGLVSCTIPQLGHVALPLAACPPSGFQAPISLETATPRSGESFINVISPDSTTTVDFNKYGKRDSMIAVLSGTISDYKIDSNFDLILVFCVYKVSPDGKG
jgi:hypothetical protein